MASVGQTVRDLEFFNLRVQYYTRPFKEQSLSLEDWMDLYGYSTYGAGPIPDGRLKLPDAEEFGEIGANTDLRSFILNVTNWVLSFLGIICIAMIIYAGYLYVVTGGEDGSEKAKKIIMYVAIGIIVILVSYALVNTIIKSTLEGGDNAENIVTIGLETVTGEITVMGEGVQDYGSKIIVPTGEEITFKVNSSRGAPEELEWHFSGDPAPISTGTGMSITKTFEVAGAKDLTVLGEIQEQRGDNTVVLSYMATVDIVVTSE
jgi:hypothetical protein